MEGWVHTPTIVTWPKVVPAGITYGGKMATFDFYATMAAAIDEPLPDGCDGKDLVPFLTGDETGDVHEFLFWHNADPTDAPRRNLYAVRWKDWRFIKYPDGWKLFDLKKDPKELNDVASGNPKVVRRLTKAIQRFSSTPSLHSNQAQITAAEDRSRKAGAGRLRNNRSTIFFCTIPSADFSLPAIQITK